MSTEKREIEPDGSLAFAIAVFLVIAALASYRLGRIADALERAYPEQKP